MPARERSLRLDAIVLRHNDWDEADRLLTLFTRELGKIRAIAKGARKPRSRKAGHLEPFMRSRLQVARGRTFFIVTQAETINGHHSLREGLQLPTYANYVVELLDRFTYEEGDHPALFNLLADTLNRLDTSDNPDLVMRFYELRLLDLVGFRPELFQCIECSEEILPEDQYFSAELGGVLCPRCGRGRPGARPVSMTALKYMRHFQRSRYAEAARAPYSPSLNQELENLLEHYITYLLERGLNTPAFLRRLRREMGKPSE